MVIYGRMLKGRTKGGRWQLQHPPPGFGSSALLGLMSEHDDEHDDEHVGSIILAEGKQLAASKPLAT